jgi:dTDP-4-amino-4,6-dideoxygalactose transaminase
LNAGWTSLRGALDALLHVGRPNLGKRAIFDRYVDQIFESAWLTNDGPLVRELESEIASRCGVRHCVAMCNGTVALEIAVRAQGLSGEVIVPSFTFVATAHALSWQGLEPVFADIDPGTHNLDPASVEARITPRTSGIIGVHLWGRAAPVDALQEIADRHDLVVMYDAAHAFGSRHRGRPIGGFGRAEVLSFHATKFFNTFEGGAIVTDDDELAHRARLMRNFGFAGYDNVVYPGTNGKMSEIAAAMGLTNLTIIDDVVAGNRTTLDRYIAAFASVGAVQLLRPDIVAMIEAGAEARDEILVRLHEAGILARKYFWPGVHKMQPYAAAGPHQHLPVTEYVADRVLVLPGGPSIEEHVPTTIAHIVEKVLHGT